MGLSVSVVRCMKECFSEGSRYDSRMMKMELTKMNVLNVNGTIQNSSDCVFLSLYLVRQGRQEVIAVTGATELSDVFGLIGCCFGRFKQKQSLLFIL